MLFCVSYSYYKIQGIGGGGGTTIGVLPLQSPPPPLILLIALKSRIAFSESPERKFLKFLFVSCCSPDFLIIICFKLFYAVL
jgi:hypothetical protein